MLVWFATETWQVLKMQLGRGGGGAVRVGLTVCFHFQH